MNEEPRTSEESFFTEPDEAPAPTGEERIKRDLRLSRRRTQSLFFLVVVVFLGGVATVYLWSDMLYFFHTRTPRDLGLAEELAGEVSLQHNDFIRIRGIARDMCIRAEIFGRRLRFLYLLGSEIGGRILIESPVGENERCEGALDQAFEGRVLDLSHTPKYDNVLSYYRSNFPASPGKGPMYLLRDGERPTSAWWYPLIFLLILFLWVINAWMFRRTHRSLKGQSSQGGTATAGG